MKGLPLKSSDSEDAKTYLATPPDDVLNSLAKLIKWCREQHGWTQERLAGKVKLTKGTIQHYESRHTIPPPRRAMDLADALEADPDWFRGLYEDQEEWERLVQLNASDSEQKFAEFLKTGDGMETPEWAREELRRFRFPSHRPPSVKNFKVLAEALKELGPEDDDPVPF